MDYLAAMGQADAFDQLVIVGKHGPILVLVPECREDIVEIAREQRRGVGGAAPMIVTPCFSTASPATVPSTLPPAEAAMSTITLPGRIVAI